MQTHIGAIFPKCLPHLTMTFDENRGDYSTLGSKGNVQSTMRCWHGAEEKSWKQSATPHPAMAGEGERAGKSLEASACWATQLELQSRAPWRRRSKHRLHAAARQHRRKWHQKALLTGRQARTSHYWWTEHRSGSVGADSDTELLQESIQGGCRILPCPSSNGMGNMPEHLESSGIPGASRFSHHWDEEDAMLPTQLSSVEVGSLVRSIGSGSTTRCLAGLGPGLLPLGCCNSTVVQPKTASQKLKCPYRKTRTKVPKMVIVTC